MVSGSYMEGHIQSKYTSGVIHQLQLGHLGGGD
uniref:Uncharacterized protein n=1 Tax=Anguilla anguilla TaxID=7936 RepID=A0A0E9V282_ANGAN